MKLVLIMSPIYVKSHTNSIFLDFITLLKFYDTFGTKHGPAE
jgi:hypothetical protein